MTIFSSFLKAIPAILLVLQSAQLAAIQPALAQKRVALVVGNNSYQNLSPDKQLKNAISDASAMRDTLRQLDFEVLYGENLDRRSLIERLFDLTARLNRGDTAFFFFAGHGVSFSGANYLLPSDVPAPRASGRAEEGRLAEQAIAETLVIDRLTLAGAQVTIVVLDACRDNPLQTPDRRSVGEARGLTQNRPVRGVFSIYSAGFGQTALDRLGPDDRNPNSLFTRVFMEKLKTPNLDLRTIVTQTRDVVEQTAERVGHNQFPAYYDQVSGEIYLADRRPSTAPVEPLPSRPPASLPNISAAARQPDLIETVRAFYQALGKADGKTAASFIIPEKRITGPLSEDEITNFYSKLIEPLRLSNVVAAGNNQFRASYSYRASRTRSCDGSALITMTERDGRAYIETIKAFGGC
jgi:hypothetical protein